MPRAASNSSLKLLLNRKLDLTPPPRLSFLKLLFYCCFSHNLSDCLVLSFSYRVCSFPLPWKKRVCTPGSAMARHLWCKEAALKQWQELLKFRQVPRQHYQPGWTRFSTNINYYWNFHWKNLLPFLNGKKYLAFFLPKWLYVVVPGSLKSWKCLL